MPRGVLTAIPIDHDGVVNPTFTAANATDGHQFLNTTTGKDQFIQIKNGGGGATVATFDITGLLANLYTVADLTLSTPAGQESYISNFNPTVFNQDGVDTVAGIAGYVFIDFDVDTSVTLALFSMPS